MTYNDKVHVSRLMSREEHLVSDLARGYHVAMQLQAEVAAQLPGGYRQTRGDVQELRMSMLALIVEAGEVLQAEEWKPWKARKPLNLEHVYDELADLHIFLSWHLNALAAHLDEPTNEVARRVANAVVDKEVINGARFRGEVPGREPPPAHEAASYMAGTQTPASQRTGNSEWTQPTLDL